MWSLRDRACRRDTRPDTPLRTQGTTSHPAARNTSRRSAIGPAAGHYAPSPDRIGVRARLIFPALPFLSRFTIHVLRFTFYVSRPPSPHERRLVRPHAKRRHGLEPR